MAGQGDYGDVVDRQYRYQVPTDPPIVDLDTAQATKVALHVASVLMAYRAALVAQFDSNEVFILVRDFQQGMLPSLQNPLLVLKPPVRHEPIRKGDWQR